MLKLLNAGFTRLLKSKTFFLLIAFSVIFPLVMIYFGYNDMKVYKGTVEIDQLILNYTIFTGLVCSIFTSLFLGVEYSDGAIRNKICIGHKRKNIYLSNLILIIITTLLSYLIVILIIVSIGIPLFGNMLMKFSNFMILMGCVFAAMVAYSSIFTFIAMIITNKTITAVISILIAGNLLALAPYCMRILEASPTIQEARFIDGEMAMFEIPNPRYPSDKKRIVIQTMLDVNPAGQMFQFAQKEVKNLKRLPLYSLSIVIVFTACGLILFEKKEIK